LVPVGEVVVEVVVDVLVEVAAVLAPGGLADICESDL
jgi:hypothetical protein